MHSGMHMLSGMHRIAPRPGAIARYTTEQGISRDELARRMGVANTTAYRVDAGLVQPSPAFIAALMNVTGLDFEALFVVEQDEVVA